ncbi:MAG: cell division protein FtsA [Bacteroidales bacterium]|nr:cell division protein FtsA [Bacteroidales bacterium]MCF8387546.1 cell division protein FtsA [Bacteroidales bacterium]MCF8397926.1 cell division protein FtsA [Bacteroidales bacterium]
MKESSEIIVGLDIGTTKIAAIVGRRNEFNKIEILGHGRTDSYGVKRGVVSNIENTVNSIKTAINQASEESEVDIKYVNVGIAGQHIKSLQHRGSLIRENSDEEISEQDIEKLHNSMYNLNMNPGEEIIDVIPQEYIIDGEEGIKEPIGMLGNSLEANFHIIIGQTAAAKNIYKCVRKAGLEVVDLILEPIASAEAVLSDEEKEAGVVLVDIGGGTTDIAIFQDGIIRHTAVIPFGGDIITEDVKEGCTIIKKHAEELKVKFGSALASENKEEEIVAIPGLRGRPPKEISLKNLASIIQARMEEIIEHIYFEIRNSGYEKKLIAGIVLTGGGAMLQHILQLTEFITGMDTRVGYPNEHLAKEVKDEVASPMYATGIGLVIEGISRFNKERTKELAELGEKRKIKFKIKKEKGKEKEYGRSEKEIGPGSFLERIQNWFEKDEIE